MGEDMCYTLPPFEEIVMNDFNIDEPNTASHNTPPALVFNLVVLSELGGEKYLFLVPKSFSDWAFAARSHFPGNQLSCTLTLPPNVANDFAPLLIAPLSPIELSIGSAENGAYLAVKRCVKVFEYYGDVMQYAAQNGWTVDERNGYDGLIF